MHTLSGAFAFALALALSAPAAADQFAQARCSHDGWRGPRRGEPRTQQALRDADQHNRQHRGHGARVLVVANDD